jgi:hypothetical protein
MPQVPDDPSSAQPSQVVEGEMPLANPTSTSIDNAPDSNGSPGLANEGHPRRSRRRRRRRPPPALPAASAGDTPIEQSASAGDPALPDGLPGTPLSAGEGHRPPRRRRRRRRAPVRQPAGQQEASSSSETKAEDGAPTDGLEQATSAGVPPQSSPTESAWPARSKVPRERIHRHHRPPRHGRPPDRPIGGESSGAPESVTDGVSPDALSPARRSRSSWQRNRSRHGEQRARGLQTAVSRGQDSRGTERRATSGPTSDRPERGVRAPGPRRRGARDRDAGRRRDAPQKKPEQKLYALESVVDRGFEDIPDEADESGTRRIHWTIIKRTVADQRSGKPMSAVYVLRREETDAEYPNLGAARAAVNKTIVHPEKLTMSKAEHAAAKK